MKKIYLFYWLLIITLTIPGCATSEQQSVPTSTLSSDSVSNLEPSPVPDPAGDYPTIIPANSVKMPVTWTNLHLSGKLIYSLGALDKNNNIIVQIQSLDLLTGNIAVLYSASQDGWI